MKKYICQILAVSALSLLLIACTQKSTTAEIPLPKPTSTNPSLALPHFEILEVGGYDNISGANHITEIQLANKSTVQTTSAKTRDIVCDGIEYTLTYDKTEIGYLYNDTGDYYRNNQGSKSIELRLNKDTGIIDRYFCYDTNYMGNDSSPELSQDACISVAREYLGKYIEDSEQYKLISTTYTPSTAYKGWYSIYFSRTIDGVRTTDRAVIAVTVHGKVILHNFFSFGEMRDAVLPPPQTMTDIEAGLEERLDAIYTPVADNYQISHKLQRRIFMRLADGSYALKYDYAVTLTPKSEEGAAFSELTSLLVRLS